MCGKGVDRNVDDDVGGHSDCGEGGDLVVLMEVRMKIGMLIIEGMVRRQR